MARYYKNRRKNFKGGFGNRNYRNKKRVSRSKTLTTLAYNMGQVNKGLKNPDSRISDSYNAGLNRVKKDKKSLF